MDEQETARFTALREDIPEWLESSLWPWINSEFTEKNLMSTFNVGLARSCERALHVVIPAYDLSVDLGVAAVSRVFDGNTLMTWRLVDYLLSRMTPWPMSDSPRNLESMLKECGIAWKVGDRSGRLGLVRRIPEGVAQAAEAASKLGNAGRRLALAWEAVYGLDSNPSHGYRLAVMAVEDAVMPVVSPNDQTGHLGKAIGSIASGSWTLPHLREDTRAPSHDVLVSMMRLLWAGQHDRHGGPSAVGVSEVTQEEAESAIALAVTLVDWFATGKVQK